MYTTSLDTVFDGNSPDKAKTPTIQLHSPNYTATIFDPKQFQSLCDRMVRAVEYLHGKHHFQAIAGCGNSAAPLLGVISVMTGIPMLLVRKAGDPCHDRRIVNGLMTAKGKYLFIDDLVDTGQTLGRVQDAISSASGDVFDFNNQMTIEAVLTYHSRPGCWSGHNYFLEDLEDDFRNERR